MSEDLSRRTCRRCDEDKPTDVVDVGSRPADLCDECADFVFDVIGAMDEWGDRVTAGGST